MAPIIPVFSVSLYEGAILWAFTPFSPSLINLLTWPNLLSFYFSFFFIWARFKEIKETVSVQSLMVRPFKEEKIKE